jgi:hypothetical protein
VAILRQASVNNEIFSSFEERIKVAILGLFANLLASVETGPLIHEDFTDVVFVALMTSQSDGIYHRALVVLGELIDKE